MSARQSGTAKAPVRSASIRRDIIIAFGCLTLLLTGVLAWKGASAWTNYGIAVDQKKFDAEADRYIAGLYEVLLERLDTNNALLAAEPASATVLAKIEGHRKIITDNFDAGLAGLEKRNFPNKQTLMQGLQAALQKAAEYRRQADDAVKRPRDQRDENLLKTFAPIITDSVNAALNVWYSALYSTAKNDPQLARLASIKEIGWRMRDYSGQERANIASAIASGAPIPANRLAANAEMRSRVDILWQQLRNLTLDDDTHPAIREAMRNAQEKYFKDFLSLSDAMRKVGEAGGQYPMTSQQWVETTNPQIGSLLNVLYAAATASEVATNAAIERSSHELEITLGLMLLSAATAIGCAIYVASRVSKPLTKLTEAMTRLAGGDLTASIPNSSDANEIGDMARSVLVLRDNGVERARLEAEAAADRAAAEAEREQSEAERRRGEDELAAVVGALADNLMKIAKGDLTTRIEAEFKGRYRQIKTDFNEAVARLEEAMRAVTESARAIQAGTEQISTAADDLSRRTEQQAASLEETAAALEEITSTVKKSAEGATHARQVVAAADDDAKKSALVVRQAVEAMGGVEKSAGQINQIIGVIDEIAFQTNLLALNAGVEAARAGDAGRGFAVVASEVRALAQRSAEAAKEIKGLITASTRQVESGVKLVGETGRSLERIVAQVAEINSVVGDIAAGAREQATGVSEVNSAINQMDRMTQDNSAMVEESTAATRSLLQETALLSRLIGQFQLSRTGENEAMRRELQKAAPHAFRPPPKGPLAQARRGVGEPVYTTPKATIAHGGSVSAAREG
ncbi:MAG TPA: methyl-accepting chemotaxis protein [Roseiarcus sp.]|nr:methyl-accepting chemotaxis protein [Roseiarcus sp.]